MQVEKRVKFAVVVLRKLRVSAGPVPLVGLADELTEAAKPDGPVSQGYTQQVLIPLLRAGLVASGRGEFGGYVLANRRKRITVHDVMAAMSATHTNGTPVGQGKSILDRIGDIIGAHGDKALKALKVDDLPLPKPEPFISQRPVNPARHVPNVLSMMGDEFTSTEFREQLQKRCSIGQQVSTTAASQILIRALRRGGLIRLEAGVGGKPSRYAKRKS